MEIERKPLQEVQTSNITTEEVTDEDEEKFRKYVSKGKQLTSEGYLRDAVQMYKKALTICYSEKLTRRIKKMEEYIELHKDSEEEDSDGSEMVAMGHGFCLYKDLYDRLYPHQKEGILWFWKLYKKGKGGILGDDMGLGKTIQVISFLSGMFDASKIKTVLIILPVSVITNWDKEFENWAPGIKVEHYHGSSKREKERALLKIQRRGGVLLTSYGMMVNPINTKLLSEYRGHEHVWDYVILDEGHKIKNPSNKSSKGIHSIPAKNRFILSGTPIQNNLKEMWALYDWCHQGSLLGTARTFAMEYDNPISKARQKDATPGEQRLGQKMAESLKQIIAPYFLRRTKAEVISDKKVSSNGTETHETKMPSFTRKNDLVVWVYLSEIQQQIYSDFSTSAEIGELLNTSRSPLTALVTLKKICDHPRLLSTRQCMKLGLTVTDELDRLEFEDRLGEDFGKECAANRIQEVDDEVLIRESGKMIFLIDLLANLRSEGHKCLLFSQSRKVLDIIQQVLKNRGHKVIRLDGTVTHISEREELINKFQNDSSYDVFLLTTQVGGVGLTLTAADRVVIYDPSWNPATDSQAVDRAFRIGQEKNVIVYRLITCGSIEEKIYRRQIFKDSIFRQTTGNSNNPYRYFSSQELKELFVLDNTRVSTTQQQLALLHDNERKTDATLNEHIAFLHSLEMFGISDHDLMFNKEAKNDEPVDEVMENDYIQMRVHNAQQLLSKENECNIQMTQELGKYVTPEVVKEKKFGGSSKPNWNFQPASINGQTSQPNTDSLMKIEASEEVEVISENGSESEKENVTADDLGVSMEELIIKSEEDVDEVTEILVPYNKSNISENTGSCNKSQLIPSAEVICLDTPAEEQQNGKINNETKQKNLFWQKFQEKQKVFNEIAKSPRSDITCNVSASIEIISDSDDDNEHNPKSDSLTTDTGKPQQTINESESSILTENDDDHEEFQNAEMGNTLEGIVKDFGIDEHEIHDTYNMSHSFEEKSAIKSVVIPSVSPSTMDTDTSLSNIKSTSTPAKTEQKLGDSAGQLSSLVDSPLANTSVAVNNSPALSNSNNSRVVSLIDSPESSATLKNVDSYSEMPLKSTPDRSRLQLSSKRRQSVCHKMTPAKSISSKSGLDDVYVVKEDLVFSPSANEQVVDVRKSIASSMWDEIDIDYSEFEQQVQSKVNSTSVFEVQKEKLGEREKKEEEMTDEESNVEDEDEKEDSKNENQDDFEEEEDEECDEQEEEMEEESEEEELSQEDEQKYLSLMKQSRNYYKRGDYRQALDPALEALAIYNADERAVAYVVKLHHKLGLS